MRKGDDMDMNWQAMLHEAANASFEKDIEVRVADDNDAYSCVDLPKAKIRELSEKILHLPQLSHYTCWMVLNICGKENTMKQNNPCYLFGMYEPDTDSVIVNAINNTYTGTPLTISCEKCNSAVLLDTPDDIAHLYRLAQENFSQSSLLSLP